MNLDLNLGATFEGEAYCIDFRSNRYVGKHNVVKRYREYLPLESP